MKIAFYSTFLNHHQIEFCDKMYEMLGDNYYFFASKDIPEDRRDQGFSTYSRPYCYNISQDLDYAHDVFLNADIVILAIHLDDWLEERIRSNKIVFLYLERLFKDKPSFIRLIRSFAYSFLHYHPLRRLPIYVLAASAYTSKDYNSLGCFVGRCYSWGYFPPLKCIEFDRLVEKKQHKEIMILWAGRLLPFKNPNSVINVADLLREENIDFKIDIIGDGILRDELQNCIENHALQDKITVHGFLPQEKVREYMERANIYLFTSNRGEGFGAVLTEAMNSGCIVIASETAGATNLLIKNEENGLVYSNDSTKELAEITLKVAKGQYDSEKMSRNAYNTIIYEQNGIVAAERLYETCESLIKGKQGSTYVSGPMSFLR